MNEHELEIKRNDNARKIKHEDAMHRNCIKIHPQNSKRHEMTKVKKCWELLQQGKEFVTEARFKDKDIRADIFVLDNGNIYEIESSDYKLEERKKDYPENKTKVLHLE